MQITTALPFISDAIALAPQAGPASALFDIVNFFSNKLHSIFLA